MSAGHVATLNHLIFVQTSLFLTHWGRVMHKWVSKITIIGSDNGLSPGRRQAIIWTNAGILSILTLGTNFSEISSKIHIFSFKKMHLQVPSEKWQPFCVSLNVLKWSNTCTEMMGNPWQGGLKLNYYAFPL